jgi:lactose/L-arabinose transport system ATP-binding protein
MSGMQLVGVRKAFGAVPVIHGIDMDVADGEFVVFVGPSGCGKSTLLRMIAGLEDVTEGSIWIGERDVTDLEPPARGIAMVFQSYALYPHMSVRDNLAFGLKLARAPRDEIDRQVATAASVLRIEPLLDRRPGQLSGGQRQRVAIGRAIVRKPTVFLFDEPLSNLDAELRVSMRIEIARLHRELGTTMIYVTHDQTEAMTLADKIVVLRDGRVEQAGTPREVYEDPENLFVAGFIGSPRMNLVGGVWRGSGQVEVAGSVLLTNCAGVGLAPGEEVTLGIRPEHVVAEPVDGNVLPLILDFDEYLGGTNFLYAQLADGQSFVVEDRRAVQAEPGLRLNVGVPQAQVRLFDSLGQRLR